MEILGTIRASSWTSFFDCSLRWYYQNVVGIRHPSSSRAHLGTSIHAGAATFDFSRINGNPVSIIEAVESTREALHNPGEDVVWDDDLKLSDADKIGAALTEKYCSLIAPHREYVAVEVQCDALDITTQYGIIRTTGTTDRIRVLDDGRMGISDIKSGARAVTKDGVASTKAHQMQLGIYTLQAERVIQRPLDAPAEIIGLKTTKSGDVATGEIEDVKSVLIGDEENPGLIEIAAKMLKSGIFPPNPSSILCSKKYCPAHGGRCKYHN
jgi:hypothetical protein